MYVVEDVDGRFITAALIRTDPSWVQMGGIRKERTTSGVVRVEIVVGVPLKVMVGPRRRMRVSSRPAPRPDSSPATFSVRFGSGVVRARMIVSDMI